jgi:hypothetical protein
VAYDAAPATTPPGLCLGVFIFWNAIVERFAGKEEKVEQKEECAVKKHLTS